MVSENSIMALKCYRLGNLWAFDDPSVGLHAEPFVAGVPEIIDSVITDKGLDLIRAYRDGIVLTFSAEYFPDFDVVVDWVRKDVAGNWYRVRDTDIEGWLCPALFKYFENAPESIYARVELTA